MVVLLASPVTTASAEEYDRLEAGNPLRIAAYILHPVGVIVDWVVFRPVHWVGSHEPFKALFGQTD